MCNECNKRKTCKKICEKIERMLPKDVQLNHVPLQDIGSLNVWNDRSFSMNEYQEEETLLKEILRPLFEIDKKASLIFIGKYYFGMDIEELSKTFKIKRRRVYHFLKEAESTVG